MIAQNIAFGIIATVMVVAAFRVVTTKDIVHAALYLVVVLAGIAAQFLLLGAEFVGATQILVYIGAVVVLFLFGIMLTRTSFGGGEKHVDDTNEQSLLSALVALLLFGVMAYAVIDAFEDTELPDNTRTTTAEVSDAIFSQYLVAFEALSVLLLAALIGAIVVARRE